MDCFQFEAVRNTSLPDFFFPCEMIPPCTKFSCLNIRARKLCTLYSGMEGILDISDYPLPSSTPVGDGGSSLVDSGTTTTVAQQTLGPTAFFPHVLNQ